MLRSFSLFYYNDGDAASTGATPKETWLACDVVEECGALFLPSSPVRKAEKQQQLHHHHLHRRRILSCPSFVGAGRRVEEKLVDAADAAHKNPENF